MENKMKKLLMRLLGVTAVTFAISIAWTYVMPLGSPAWRILPGWIMIWASIDFYIYCRSASDEEG